MAFLGLIWAKARKVRYSLFDMVLFGVLLGGLGLFWLKTRDHQYQAAAANLNDAIFQSPLPAVTMGTEQRIAKDHAYQHAYEFGPDYFTYNIPIWEKVMAPYKGKPNVHYLEIGVFEGRSSLWVLENILTHPTARLTGIDPFTGPYKERCLANVQRSGAAEKVNLITGYSQLALRQLPFQSFDIIYIDGSHAKDNTLEDAVLSWRLVKEDGLIIFDDYRWAGVLGCATGEDGFADDEKDFPKPAIDAFAQCFDNKFTVIHNSYQLILKRKKS